jgi:hypothetical protein
LRHKVHQRTVGLILGVAYFSRGAAKLGKSHSLQSCRVSFAGKGAAGINPAP